MIPAITDDEDAADQLADLLQRAPKIRATKIVAFTGAGISTECGVPDFRSAGSPWLQNKPIPFPAFVANEEARREAWRRKFTMDDLYAGAVPGRGHMALSKLHGAGLMPALITQNIDGLHQAAGLPQEAVIEIHGNGTYAKCLSCAQRHELADIRTVFEATGSPPSCEACGGMLKSATISFGQAMPQAAMRVAAQHAVDADIFMAIGSSLVVFPAAGLPKAAKEHGSRLVIINQEPTGLDQIADLVIRADIGTLLDKTIVKMQL